MGGVVWRPQATAVVSESVYAAAEAVFVPATRQVAVTTSGAGGSLTSTTALDEGGRVIGTRAASGGVTRSVWAPFDDVLLATIYPNGQAQATVFDRWFRRVAKHMGPLEAFGAGCAPDSPGRGVTDAVSGDWTACAPLAGTTEAASQLIGFDTPSGVGSGLTATVFAAPAAGLPSPFSGNPVAHGAADQDPDVGIPVAAVAPAAVSGSGLRLDGGLVVPTDAGTAADSWTLRVVAPADLVTSGVVMVDGEFCAVLDGGEGSCAVTPDANTAGPAFHGRCRVGPGRGGGGSGDGRVAGPVGGSAAGRQQFLGAALVGRHHLDPCRPGAGRAASPGGPTRS